MKQVIPKFAFLISAIALFITGCGGELSRYRVKVIFENGTGFKLPDDATGVFGIESASDFHGDFSAALTFTVSQDEMRALRNLSRTEWAHPEDFKAIPYARDFLGGDTTLRPDKAFMIPGGTLLIEQNGPKDQIRRFAIDESAGRIYFYRCTW